jgi:ABC-type Fe3+/spermidine/putrescine transport system ATPase subunit
MSEVDLRQVSKRYGAFVAVDDVNLTLVNGVFVTLLGASGSGKSTTLRIVAGFVKPDTASR